MTLSKPIPCEARTSLRIPLVSANVEAGFPSPAEDHTEQALDLNQELISNPPPPHSSRKPSARFLKSGRAGWQCVLSGLKNPLPAPSAKLTVAEPGTGFDHQRRPMVTFTFIDSQLASQLLS